MDYENEIVYVNRSSNGDFLIVTSNDKGYDQVKEVVD
jgi:hypothetical protein